MKEERSTFITKLEQQQKEEKEKHKNEIDQLKNAIFESYKIIGDNDNLETFNELNGEAQSYIMAGLINNNEEISQIVKQIGSLLLFLSDEIQRSKSDIKLTLKNYVYIYSKQMNASLFKISSIEWIEINSDVISILYENGSLHSNEFIQNINNFNVFYIQFKHSSFTKEIYSSVLDIKNNKSPQLKISVIIDKIEKSDTKFQRYEDINKVVFDQSVKILPGGINKGSFEHCY